MSPSLRLGSRYRHEYNLVKPGVVEVRNPAGVLIATIDPLTRERRNAIGRLEAVLTP